MLATKGGLRVAADSDEEEDNRVSSSAMQPQRYGGSIFQRTTRCTNQPSFIANAAKVATTRQPNYAHIPVDQNCDSDAALLGKP